MKTVVPARVPWVRIPPLPPLKKIRLLTGSFQLWWDENQWVRRTRSGDKISLLNFIEHRRKECEGNERDIPPLPPGQSGTITLMPSSELSVVFCYVYLLRSTINGNLYIGFTHDLKKRIAEHNKGLNRSTKPYRPWELLYYEAHRNDADGQRREHYLKTTAGERALRNMLREQFSDLNKQKVYY